MERRVSLKETAAAQGFNSLQTGKHMESATVKHTIMESAPVSIPFKRESTWKARMSGISQMSMKKSFNSLQTGKHMERFQGEFTTAGLSDEFQFPSNGKAHGKEWTAGLQYNIQIGFNSLQTGKHMESI